ncbi:Sodium channel protein para [Orchesella cincta]|uniref:Sodium channel protein para n=1 Tax=Orchesella cincta TaxID=48709 RepID=A0A1D2MFD0_ORCCI|nr:Sodium channel protein para [Orchesella cincta]
MPRWNFTDFGHSFMIIFRVLCGEWIESMWDCMLVTGGACVPFFLATVVIGNLVVLNLFLALLLSSFGASNLSSSPDAETNKIAEAFGRIGRFIRWVKAGVRAFFKAIGDFFVRAKNQIVPRSNQAQQAEAEAAAAAAALENSTENAPRKRPRLADTARLVMNSKKLMNNLQQMKEAEAEAAATKEEETLSMKSYGSHTHYPKQKRIPNEDGSDYDEDEKQDMSKEDLEWIEDEEGEETGEGEQAVQVPKGEEEEYPADCMPPRFYERFPVFAVDDTPFGVAWSNIRLKTFRLIENKYFETAVIIMILLSSLALALEDVHLPGNPILTDILFYMDRIFTVIFFFEMLIKFLALGFVAYFTNAWCWLDFVIVMVSLINFVAALCGAGSVQAFKTMRTLRALRPLRAMSRMQGMRIVVTRWFKLFLVFSMCYWCV